MTTSTIWTVAEFWKRRWTLPLLKTKQSGSSAYEQPTRRSDSTYVRPKNVCGERTTRASMAIPGIEIGGITSSQFAVYSINHRKRVSTKNLKWTERFSTSRWYEDPGLDLIKVYWGRWPKDRKSTRLNSSHGSISYAVFCLK